MNKLGINFGQVGVNLGPSWAILVRTWDQFGPAWANLAPTWTIGGHLGANLGPTSYPFGSPLRQIEPTWAQLATTWNQLWPGSASQTPRQSQPNLQKSFKNYFFNTFGFQAIQTTTYAHHPHFRRRKSTKNNPTPPSSTQIGTQVTAKYT